MAEITHPGSWVGDSVEEFKKLPTWGKLAAGGGLIAVVLIALRARQASSGSGATSAGAAPAAGGIQSPFGQVPGGNGGSTPLIPAGVAPIFDGTGNLIGWQNNPPPTVTPPGTNPTVPPAPPTVGPPRLPGPGPHPIIHTPLVPDSLKVWMGRGGVLYKGTSVNHQSVVSLPHGTTLRAGSNGRYWAIGPGGSQQLITNKFQSSPPR